MKFLALPFLLIWTVCEFCAISRAFGHGFAGARFFPATLSTDDPFVSDELSLPTVSTMRTPDDGGTRETEISVDVSKRITREFAIEIGDSFTALNPHEGPAASGFGNLELGGKYQLLKSEAHEAIVSIGLGVEVGGTGSRSVGVDSFSTWTPSLFFGKGLGDLSQPFSLVRPFAITGVFDVAIPTSASTRTFIANEQAGASEADLEHHPNLVQYGFAVEYSFIYLQEQVRDIGLPEPFDHLIPLVEFSFETALNRGQEGETTGTINPGVIWSGKYFQIGAEAVLPINSRTGSDVGFIAQLHFYLDDLFPRTIGRPLFAGE
jgi:hypothetical protein